MILGAVNFAFTFPGLYVIEKAGRRGALMWGASWMFMCFMVFSSVGHFSLDQADPTSTPKAGAAMIVFACKHPSLIDPRMKLVLTNPSQVSSSQDTQ